MKELTDLVFPDEIHYAQSHEWAKNEGDRVKVGITDYAQDQLGDIVFVELPEEGSEVKQMEAFGTIEAVKAVSELFSPVTGTVSAVNNMVDDDAGIINKDPYGEGWMIKVKVSETNELDNLLDANAYNEMVEG